MANNYSPQYTKKGVPDRPVVTVPLDSKEPSMMVLLYGRSSTGKTRLAATFPDAMCYDVDGGAMSAGFSLVRQVPMDPGSVTAIYDDLVKLAGAPYDAKTHRYTFMGKQVGTVVIDPIDRLQQACMPFILKDRLQMEMRDWGHLLNLMTPILDILAIIEVPSVIIAHDKIREPIYKREGWNDVLVARGTIDTEIGGALRERVKNQATIGAYLTLNDAGKRILYFREGLYITQNAKPYNLMMTKDRHHWARRDSMTMQTESGMPEKTWADALMERWWAYLAKQAPLPQIDEPTEEEPEAPLSLPVEER